MEGNQTPTPQDGAATQPGSDPAATGAQVDPSQAPTPQAQPQDAGQPAGAAEPTSTEAMLAQKDKQISALRAECADRRVKSRDLEQQLAKLKTPEDPPQANDQDTQEAIARAQAAEAKAKTVTVLAPLAVAGGLPLERLTDYVDRYAVDITNQDQVRDAVDEAKALFKAEMEAYGFVHRDSVATPQPTPTPPGEPTPPLPTPPGQPTPQVPRNPMDTTGSQPNQSAVNGLLNTLNEAWQKTIEQSKGSNSERMRAKESFDQLRAEIRAKDGGREALNQFAAGLKK